MAVEGVVEEVAADSSSTGPVEGAKVTLNLRDKEEGNIPVESQITGKDGRYRFDTEAEKDYTITVEREGFFTRSILHSTRNVTKSDTAVIDMLEIAPIVEEKAIVLENIYYDFDKATLRPSAKTTLDEVLMPILVDNPSLIIEIGSHTDSKGTDSYNLSLSKRRAQSVVHYLIDKGTEKRRLRFEGYGERQLIVQDEYSNGYDEDAQQLNRRTEFKVVGTVKLRE